MYSWRDANGNEVDAIVSALMGGGRLSRSNSIPTTLTMRPPLCCGSPGTSRRVVLANLPLLQ